jgi:hypothetical protein
MCSPLFAQLAAIYGEDQVFWDQGSMENGPFAPQLEGRVKAAKTVFIMIGDVDRWLGKSNEGFRIKGDECWVRKEVRLALTHGALVIPVVNGTRIPTTEELPEDLQDLLGCHFEKMPLAPGWETEGVARLIAKLKRQTALDPSVPAVLRRLIKPVQSYPADVRAALASEAAKQQLWALFQAAQGIVATVEERTEVNGQNLSLEGILECLAMTVHAEGLLKFLALIVYRQENNLPVFPRLPPALRTAWSQVLNEAVQGTNPTWVLDGKKGDALLDWAQEGDLCPRFHLCFDLEQADDRVGWQYRVTGWACLGLDQRKLENEAWGLDWDERFTLTSPDGAAGISEALSPTFQAIAKRVERWLGRAAATALPEAHRPVIEVYLRGDQIAWPVEQAQLTPATTVGSVFRMSRRLHQRHAADTPPTKWIQRSGKVSQPLRSQDVATVQDWTTLRQLAEIDVPLAFSVAAPADEAAHDLIMELHLLCGLWTQRDTAVTPEKLGEIFTTDGCPKEAVRDRRDKAAWRDVAVFHDTHPGLRPPGLPDSKRAQRRTAND